MMTLFGIDEFYKLLVKVNIRNKVNFDSFTEKMAVYLDHLTFENLEEIIEFLVFESNICSDSQLKLLSADQIIELCAFINDIQFRASSEEFIETKEFKM